ncbi:MAG: RpiB/LacA/LacB family sugar-phosphate isomerase [Chloroflexi bacterium]|nr:RpiB/LacA/LacB family sugar-phosphate isomerase [Chloroflexota bacterium]
MGRPERRRRGSGAQGHRRHETVGFHKRARSPGSRRRRRCTGDRVAAEAPYNKGVTKGLKIAIGADERTHLTDAVVDDLRKRGCEVELHGALGSDDPRWPEVARVVAERVASGHAEQGVLFCWTGTGVSMAANKVPGARAALCADAETARGARKWNDANILCMSLRLTAPIVAKEILDAWFTAGVDASERDNIERVKAMDSSKSRAT